jgi:hypothetical protein
LSENDLGEKQREGQCSQRVTGVSMVNASYFAQSWKSKGVKMHVRRFITSQTPSEQARITI